MRQTVCAMLAVLTVAHANLNFTVYDNTARTVSKTTITTLLSNPEFTVDNSEPFSAELSGSIVFDSPGIYEFMCNFTRTTTVFVWVDGHMVCVDGMYKVDPNSMDNPLQVTPPLFSTLYSMARLVPTMLSLSEVPPVDLAKRRWYNIKNSRL